MLYNPKWEIKADPFSLESLIARLEQQPAGETYNFLSSRNCLLGRYFKSQGFSDVSISGYSWRGDGIKRKISLDFRDVARPKGWHLKDTIGGALERARDLQ